VRPIAHDHSDHCGAFRRRSWKRWRLMIGEEEALLLLVIIAPRPTNGSEEGFSVCASGVQITAGWSEVDRL
jgi:hypothetical protein